MTLRGASERADGADGWPETCSPRFVTELLKPPTTRQGAARRKKGTDEDATADRSDGVPAIEVRPPRSHDHTLDSDFGSEGIELAERTRDMSADEETERMTLGLDTEKSKSGATESGVTRMYLAVASSFLKEGGQPTLAPACQSYSELSQEIDRLAGELETLRQQGRTWFGVEDENDEPAAERNAADEPASRPVVGTAASLRVCDVMTREVETLDSNQQLAIAKDLMHQRRIRHLPILGEENELVGIVSQRDLFFGALAWSMGQGELAQQKALEAFSVKQVMHTDVVTIDPDKPLSEAARLMAEHKIGCLPVLRAGRLIGILTEADFVALYRQD